MVDMARALKSAEMAMMQTSQVTLPTLLGESEVMSPALVRNRGVTATCSLLETAEVVMCSTRETNASKDPGHFRHHPPQPIECLCQSRLSQLLYQVGHVI